MSNDLAALGRAFLAAWQRQDDGGGAEHAGRPGEAVPEAAIGARVDEHWRRASVRWRGVALPAEVFARHAGERAPRDREVLAAIEKLHGDDLFLACACAERSSEALEAFDSAFLSRMPTYLAALKPTPTLVDDVRQALREKLFVGTRGSAPKILQYTGRGALEGWVRVAAVRTALNLTAEHGPSTPVDEDAAVEAAATPAGVDAELDYIKAHYRDDVGKAFREALGSLAQRERTLLRFHYVDQLPPGRIGAIYGVHRTTALRWIEAAEAELFARMRERLMAKLGASEGDCDSLLELVKSRLEVTLGALEREGE